MGAICTVYYQENAKIIYLENILSEPGMGLKTTQEISLFVGWRTLKDTFVSWNKR